MFKLRIKKNIARLLGKKNDSLQEKRFAKWFKDNGDKTMRLNYDLDENSVIFDVGGFQGDWTAEMFCKYDSTFYIFEPVKQYAANIKARFEKNKKVFVFQYGLSNINRTEKISVISDASSVYKIGNELEEIHLRDASEFIEKKNISNINLMKINIEGGEYDLLQNLIDSQLVKKIDNLQIQFHDFVPNAEEKMRKIQDELKKTHYLTYQYEFVWENWKKKEAN